MIFMDADKASDGSLNTTQLKQYAQDLAEVYKSEQEKRKELEAAYGELQQTKDMLVQSEKLAAIGRLTAGVAHEILNPVNIISMRLQLLKMTEDLSDRAREAIRICENQLSRIIEISKDLGQFSRIHEKQTTMCDLKDVIGHVLTLGAPQLKKEGITIDVHYHPGLPLIPLDKNRIEQVILNIISNAIAAMAGQATKVLRITTKPASEDHVLILISDTGTGIDQGDITAIFDPFFTTKHPDQGTGLGLFISYNIIKGHGGRIWAENNESGGSSFFIELPVITPVPSQRSLEREI
jgi:signal transduction histidine kinase